MQAIKHLVLFGGNDDDVHAFLWLHPKFPASKLLHVELEEFLLAYDKFYR